MKIRLRFLIIQAFVLSLAFWLYGCSSKYYMPTMQNVPEFKTKGDFTATGVFTATSEIKGSGSAEACELQTGYALFNHFAILGGGTKVFHKKNKGHMIDTGVGYYSALPDYQNKSVGLYVMGSSGRVFPKDFFSYFQDSIYIIQRVDYGLKRVFVQGVLNPKFRYMQFSISARLVYLNLSVSDELIKKLSGVTRFDPNDFGPNHFYFLEPALTYQVGSDNVKFHFQAAFVVEMGQNHLPHNNINLNAGLSVCL